ncbi:primase-helicase family protein [Methylocystis echinoides]|uniref:primase-helicase family protein n=1 Tax=Methylocystis echinoides TaxID=29468 RepID=UPI0034278C24
MNVHVKETTILPLEDAPEFKKLVSQVRNELVEKFAWSAQHDGIVYRQDPLKAPPMKDATFNRISRSAHSFLYINKKGKKDRWYESFEDVLSALDDPDSDFGFVMAEAVEFLPGQSELSKDGLGRLVLNLWRAPPWQIIADAEPPQPLLIHLAYLFDGDQQAVDHILDFMAHLLQRPEERVNHAILLTSEAKGIGKSTLGTIVRRLVGQRNSRVAQSKDLKSSFDGWLVGQLIIQVDEIYEYGNWDLANKLKPIITEPTVSVNIKYGPEMEVQNFARLLMFSNHEAPIDLEEGDRRYFVFNSKAQPKDTLYYEELNAYIDSKEGMNAIYTFLMKRDLSRFKPFAPPPLTEAKKAIIKASGSPLKHYIAEVVANGHLMRELRREFTLDELVRQLTKEGYGQQVKNTKELGMALKAAGVTQGRRGSGERRVRVYILPEPVEPMASIEDAEF